METLLADGSTNDKMIDILVVVTPIFSKTTSTAAPLLGGTIVQFHLDMSNQLRTCTQISKVADVMASHAMFFRRRSRGTAATW